MFDNMDALLAPKISDARGELDRYLNTDVEEVRDAVMWWAERKAMYPALWRMALDYLTTPGKQKYSSVRLFLTVSAATSIDVEQLFSRGHLVLSHTRSQLATQTTHAILCLGAWSKMGLVKDMGVLAVAKMKEVEGEDKLHEGWDAIVMD
jgi:hypothetical protein